MTDNSERRKFKRVPNIVSVKINQKKENEPRTRMDISKTTNVSAGGLLIKHDKPISLGSLVSVSFMKPNSFDMITVDAKVVRLEENPNKTYDIGIAFINLAPDEEKKLDYLLQK